MRKSFNASTNPIKLIKDSENKKKGTFVFDSYALCLIKCSFLALKRII